jgi:hypothetical protein
VKFIPIICCLFILSGCSEKRKDEIVIENKSCIHFTQHSRQLPIVNSAIEIFEGQQFDGVIEVIKDSVHFILQPDSNLLEPPKVLVFIDQEEVAPYRELISQQLPSGGYWIYYACYDSLGNECFLPEFYDVDHFKIAALCCVMYVSKPETEILQNANGAVQISSEFFFESYESDSAKTTLSMEIKNKIEFIDKSLIFNDTGQLQYRWKDRSLFRKIWAFKPDLEISKWTIHLQIKMAHISVYDYDSLPPLSEVYYKVNYQNNMNLISLANQSWNDLFILFKQTYGLTEKDLQIFTHPESQQIPFQISSPIVFFYWTNSIWDIVPPPPPPIDRISCPINPPMTTKSKEDLNASLPDEIEIIEEDEIDSPIGIDLND